MWAAAAWLVAEPCRRFAGRGGAVQLGCARERFCRLGTAGDVAGLKAIFSRELNQALDAAMANPALMPPTVLFQSYTNVVPQCQAKTRNAALVEIDRGNPPRGVPSWTDYLVVAPETDGGTRIDDVLFATRRSDTLRARLAYYALRAEGPHPDPPADFAEGGGGLRRPDARREA